MLKLPLSRCKDLITHIETESQGELFGFISFNWIVDPIPFCVCVHELKRKKRNNLVIIHFIDLVGINTVSKPYTEKSKELLFNVSLFNGYIILGFLKHTVIIPLYKFLPQGNNTYSKYLKDLINGKSSVTSIRDIYKLIEKK